MQEIERKFLVHSDVYKREAFKSSKIAQGFLNSEKSRTVRVRITDKKGFLTVKGLSSASGLSRFEWETEVPYEEAKALLKLCEPGQIEKRRYYVNVGKHIFEVDEFYGENQGLTIAEIELSTEDETFETPDWLAKEVTGEVKYFNSMLSKTPYKQWT
ncbi:triphosphate tunnel metalloenzyme-like protein [Psychroflexus torquis ATCC 700755]|uniref:Triphosphate tunnel metalloenzyme-like protein n=1 Tax=Psychroflexus torquis (strain ATCC 700755 / CIP 106069 / ACAM 623) TaxID=313595 RepID=K4ICX2_PSYTT|nr:CYTH domain-containing protein [Psychroflexus torquis]AFU68437.1 triphosphate tunnel metalloenzyme-like protein [Psychroflexus torquis ATCC 700755]